MNPVKMITALVEAALPAEPNEGFAARDRQRFFDALAANLDVIYGAVEPAPTFEHVDF